MVMQVLSHEEGFRRTLAARIGAIREEAPQAARGSIMMEEFAKLLMVMREAAHRVDEGDNTATLFLRNMADRGQAWLTILGEDRPPETRSGD